MSKDSDKPKQKANKLIRFSGVALQMAVLITAGAVGGRYLDDAQCNEKPIWSITFSLLGIAIGLYLVIKEAMKLTNDD